METSSNRDTVARWFQKYVLPATQRTEMTAGDTTLSPFAEPFVPRGPETTLWPADLLDGGRPDLPWGTQTRWQTLPVQSNGHVRAMTDAVEHPARRPIGYERAQKHRRQETEAGARESSVLGFSSSGVEIASDGEMATAFLEGLQGGVATLRGGDFYPGQYTVFSGLSLWDRLTSADRSFEVTSGQGSTDGERSNSTSVSLSLDKDTSGNSDNGSCLGLSEKDTSDSSSSPGLSSDKDTRDNDSHSLLLEKYTSGNRDNGWSRGLSSDSDTQHRKSSSRPEAPDPTYGYPRRGDVSHFTYPLTSLDLLTIKDRSSPIFSYPRNPEKTNHTFRDSPPTNVTVPTELETTTDKLSADAVNLAFHDDVSNSLESSDTRSLTNTPAYVTFSDSVKSEDGAFTPNSVSSQNSSESACRFHVGWNGQSGSRSDSTPPLSPHSTASACSNPFASDDVQLACSATCRHSQHDMSSDGRSSVDSGIGVSVSAHSYVTTDLKDAPEESLQGHHVTEARLCPEHPGKRQNLYCADCLRLICPLCFAAYHLDCTPVLTPDRACRAVRWQLVKLQSNVDKQIADLQRRASLLRSHLDSSGRWARQSKDLLNDQFLNIITQLEDKRRQLLWQIDAAACETSSSSALHEVERGLLILNYVSQFVEVLRNRDSAWELLATFDLRLSQLLERVLHRTANCSSYKPPTVVTHKQVGVDQCQLTALEMALQSLDLQTRTPMLGDEVESDTLEGRMKNNGSCGCDTGSSASRLSVSEKPVDDDRLLSEVLSYLNRFPPPVSCWRGSGSTESSASSQHEDLDDDVFESAAGGTGDEREELSHVTKVPPLLKEYRLQQRLCPDFLQDRRKPFITDIHVTETGQLVLIDVANDCLKRVNPRAPSSLARRVQVAKPLCVCSAGWERVLVSCAGRVLELYSVGGPHVRLLAHRDTRRQYVGITRASDALVAAACPETHSIDLLDFSGRLLRSVMPVCFEAGPKVVGTTASGQLLVIHQPAQPPTTIVCFDMSGRVIWKHELHVRHRHVVCSKIIGSPDGDVIFGLQEQSTLYSFSPKDGVTRVLMTPQHGLKFPSGLAQDGEGRLFIARSDLQREPLSLVTSEVDVYADVTIGRSSVNKNSAV